MLKSTDDFMKVCFFTKYPPIEGGTSSRSYWLARGLGEKGIEVHIITDAFEEKCWLEKIDFENIEDLTNLQPKNVYLHSLDANIPDLKEDKRSLIFNSSRESRLISLGLEVINSYNCDIIDSRYFFPYGLAAYWTKKITNLPLILRHATSDIATLISKRSFHYLFRRIFSESDLIITDRKKSGFFQELGIPFSQKFHFSFNYGIDSQYFNPYVSAIDLSKYGLKIDADIPIITYIGKMGRAKGIYELAKAASQIKGDFLLLFVAGGPNLEDFRHYIEKFPALKNKYFFLGFVPPWRIPSILRSSRCLLNLEKRFSFMSHFPSQPLEAMAVGVCPMVSDEIHESYKNLPGVEKDKNILVVNPNNPRELKKTLERIIKDKNFSRDIGEEAAKVFNKDVFPIAISKTLKIYEILSGNKSFKRYTEKLKRAILRYC